MKVVHIQSYLLNTGNAAYRLHNLMLKNGVESSMLMYKSSKKDPTIQQVYSKVDLIKKIYNKLLFSLFSYFKTPETYQYSYEGLGTDISNHEFVRNADVIYLHWISGGFLNIKNIEQLASLRKPVFFFLHDMWAITGGCHHSLDCNKYMSNCENCPMFHGRKISFASIQFLKKKKLMDKYDNIYFISPSEWLKEKCLKSKIAEKHFCASISNVVDEAVFKPIDKLLAKQILNIDNRTKVITFGCVLGTSNPYKGSSYLLDALKLLDHNLNILILIYGSDYDASIAAQLDFPVRFFGEVHDEITMSIINNATDVFVSPSLVESFGLTLLENLKCGTPVVGFNTSAIPEIICHKKNGYLAALKDANDLSLGIKYVLNNKWNLNCNVMFSSSSVISLHLNLCKLVLHSN